MLAVGGAIALPLHHGVTAAPKSTPSPAKLAEVRADRSRVEPDAAERLGMGSGSGKSVATGEGFKLNYFEARWSKVLGDLAEATGTELVADRFPSRPYTRLDRRPYSHAEAIRILNKDLEKYGQRLLLKQRHLVMVDALALRTEYSRPVAGGSPLSARTAGRRGEAPVGDVEADAGGVQTAGAEDEAAPRKQMRVRHVGDEQPAPAGKPVRTEEKEDAKPKTSELLLENQDAVDVAKVMRTAFGKNAELLTEGPGGFPGFRVRLAGDGVPEVEILIGIDEQGNRLVVTGPAIEVDAVAKFVKGLDVAQGRAGRTVKAITTKKDAGQIARVLPEEMQALAQANRDAADNPEADKADPNANRQPGLPELLDNLRGDVQVESVPDLGVLILRGNQRDVDAVMQVIREIERMSGGATPDVQILMLQNVSSEGLSSLLSSIYERLRTARGSVLQQSQSVSIIPIARPNAILILAAAADMEAVLKLAKELDQPVDPKSEFKVIRLKHAVPTQVVEAVEAMYPAPTGTGNTTQQRTGTDTTAGLVPRVRITTDIRTNSVVVQARPRDLVEVEAFIGTLDTTESNSVSQIRIFPLKSATAENVAETLSTAIQSVTAPPRATTTGGQGGGQFGGQTGGTTGGSTELRAVKSSVLQFLRTDGNAQEMARSGILADIRVTPDIRTNSLVVTAPEESMGLMEALIKSLDRPSATVAEIKVFSLVRADATLTAELLQTLFTQQGQQGGGLNRNGQGGGNQGIPGLQVAGADDTSSTLVPLRFSVDVRTNSIIAVGGGEALNVVEALLARLDDSDVRQREMIVYKLKNSYAPDVANAITQFLTSRRQIESADSGLVSPFEQIEREVVVQSEAATNSLLISATPRYFKEIINLVEKLDAAPQQVVISALIVEVTLENTDEFGVELGFQDSVLFDRSVISNVVQVPTTNTSPNGVQTTTQNVISQTVTPGFLFNNQAFGQNPVNTSKVGAQSLTNFAVGRVNGDLGYGGLVLSAGSESVNVLLRALAARRRVDILSRPQIRTLDNQIAQIQVGQQVPIVNGVNTGIAGNAQPIVVQDQAGIILTVTPRITPDQMIVMEVIAEKSQFTGAGVPIFTDATTGNVITSPIKDLTNARATVGVRDGQTIVLGGMITNSKEQVERKVPFLGDIPILGIAFRYDFNSTRRTELLMFLTPHVIRTDEDNEFHKQVETQRIHFTEYDAEAIHGPILAVPMGDQYCPPDALPPELMPYSQQPGPYGNTLTPPVQYGPPGATFDPTIPGVGGDTPTTVMPVVPGPSGQLVPPPDLSPVPDETVPRGLPGPQSSRKAKPATSAAATAMGPQRRVTGGVQPVRYDAPVARERVGNSR